MSREVSAEELRAFAEACGWHRYGIVPDFLHDLNACFEALEWFCELHQYAWRLEWLIVGPFYRIVLFTIGADGEVVGKGKQYTKQAAIIRAVNAAAKVRKP